MPGASRARARRRSRGRFSVLRSLRYLLNLSARSSRVNRSSLVPSGSSVLPRAFLVVHRRLHPCEGSVGARVTLFELEAAAFGHPQKGGVGLGQHRAVLRTLDRAVRLDDAATIARDLADDPQFFTDRHW